MFRDRNLILWRSCTDTILSNVLAREGVLKGEGEDVLYFLYKSSLTVFIKNKHINFSDVVDKSPMAHSYSSVYLGTQWVHKCAERLYFLFTYDWPSVVGILGYIDKYMIIRLLRKDSVSWRVGEWWSQVSTPTLYNASWFDELAWSVVLEGEVMKSLMGWVSGRVCTLSLYYSFLSSSTSYEESFTWRLFNTVKYPTPSIIPLDLMKSSTLSLYYPSLDLQPHMKTLSLQDSWIRWSIQLPL